MWSKWLGSGIDGARSRSGLLAAVTILAGGLPVDAAVAQVEYRVQFGGNAAVANYDPAETVSDPSAVEDQTRLTLRGGVSLSFPLPPGDRSLWMEVGAILEGRGGKTRLSRGEDGVVIWQLDYVAFPALLRYELASAGTRPYLKAGFDVAVAAKKNLWNERFELSLGALRDFDISAVGGAGIAVDLGHATLFSEATYTHGLRDVNEVSYAVVDVKLFNRTWGAVVGVAYAGR